jgi:hypothetical protein
MKSKVMFILCIVIFLFFSTQPLFSVAYNQNNDQNVVRVAILDAVIPSFISPEHIIDAIDGYSWEVEEKSYIFKVNWITDGQIRRGKLNRNNYDVLIIPGIGKEFKHIFDGKIARWKNQIRQFIENGGGYVGMCGGANMAVSSHVPFNQRGWKTPTFWEWFMNKSCLGIVEAKSYQDMGDPFAATFLWKNPARLGISAFIWYNFTNEGVGVSTNLTINTTHPIFNGYEKSYRLMRWNSGPALIPFSENVSVLAWYPETNISGPNGSPNTSIHSWKYVGPLSGHFLKQRSLDFWDKDVILETHLAGKPAAIADNYGDGRVVVYGPHPEHEVLFDEQIIESEDTNNNHLFLKDRLYKKEYTNENLSYNWWVVRRSVAWSANVPDDSLPPIR